MASDSAQASQAGVEILRAGGNALDAAVATAFALGVNRPHMCGLGGNAWVLYRDRSGRYSALDAGYTGPAAIGPETLGTTPGGIDDGFSGFGHRVVGVPGFVVGLAEALRTLGTMPLGRVIEPAARLARNGIVVSRELSEHMAYRASRLRMFPESARVFLVDGERPYPPGSTLVQPDLARSLESIAADGPRAFTHGWIAAAIAADMERSGAYPGDRGILTAADLADYRPVWRTPIDTRYRRAKVTSFPPPHGGLYALELLNLLEGFDLARFGPSSADALHAMAEAQKIADADDGTYVWDPAFVGVPTAELTSRGYAERRRAEIAMSTARTYPPGLGQAGPERRYGCERPRNGTSHVSVVDQWGNAAAITCTLRSCFGSMVVTPGTGFALNNGAKGFYPGPGAAAPGKFATTPVAPTIVEAGGQVRLVLGGVGSVGSVRAVPAVISNVLDHDMDVARAVDAERLFEFQDHAGQSMATWVEEDRLPPGVLDELDRRGHNIEQVFGEYGCGLDMASVPTVAVDPWTGARTASGDPRVDIDTAAVQ